MNEINRKLPAGLAITAGISLILLFLTCVASFISIIMLNNNLGVPFYSAIINLLRLWTMIPLAIVMFCRTKSVFAGCVFAYYGLDQLVGGLFTNILASLLAQAPFQWAPSLSTLLNLAFWALLSIACFGSKKQLLRKVRWLFIVLPLLFAPVLAFNTTAGQLQIDPTDMIVMFISNLLAQSFTHLPHLLIGLAFFFSYPKKIQAAPAPRCCSACGKQLDSEARFCPECGLPVE